MFLTRRWQAIPSKTEGTPMSRPQVPARPRQDLRRQSRDTHDTRLHRRTLAVVEFDRGRAAADIARLLGVSRQSAHNRAATSACARHPTALADADHPGRPRLPDEGGADGLQSSLHRSPQEFGSPQVSWTAPLLQQASATAPARHPSRAPPAGGRGGSTPWGSDRVTPSPRTRGARKKRRRQRQTRALPRRGAVLAAGQTDRLPFPPLRAGGARRGEAAQVLLSGWGARRAVFGAMNLRTGARLFVPRQRGRREDWQALLGAVRPSDRGWPVATPPDEDRGHTARASLARAGGLGWWWLPRRSPELNPMATPWGQGKDAIGANQQDEPIAGHEGGVPEHLLSLSNRQARPTSGVLSEDFRPRRTLSKTFRVPA